MVGAGRFELPTPSPPDWCANQAALRSEPAPFCPGGGCGSTGAAAAASVAAYLVNSLAALVDFLEPFRKVSPFYHSVASDPLRHGLGAAHVGFLVALATVAAIAAVAAFDRRDLTG